MTGAVDVNTIDRQHKVRKKRGEREVKREREDESVITKMGAGLRAGKTHCSTETQMHR